MEKLLAWVDRIVQGNEERDQNVGNATEASDLTRNLEIWDLISAGTESNEELWFEN